MKKENEKIPWTGVGNHVLADVDNNKSFGLTKKINQNKWSLNNKIKSHNRLFQEI